MKSIHKVFLGTFVLAVILLIINQVQVNKKVNMYIALNETLTEKIQNQEIIINDLTKALEDAQKIIEAQEPIVESYQELSKFIDFDALDTTQLEKANEISSATPLDYESALVLVKYADQYDVPYSLVLSIIDIESGFKSNLVGQDQDRGYMQIIPGTEKWLANAFGDELGLEYDPSRIFEAEYNLALGIKYLDELISGYGTNYDRILSEYNRGPSNLAKYYTANQTYSTSYSRKVLSKVPIYVALND